MKEILSLKLKEGMERRTEGQLPRVFWLDFLSPVTQLWCDGNAAWSQKAGTQCHSAIVQHRQRSLTLSFR